MIKEISIFVLIMALFCYVVLCIAVESDGFFIPLKAIGNGVWVRIDTDIIKNDNIDPASVTYHGFWSVDIMRGCREIKNCGIAVKEDYSSKTDARNDLYQNVAFAVKKADSIIAEYNQQ